MLELIDIDRYSIAESMTALVKSHMRVEHDRDDSYVTHAIQRAIGFFEKTTEHSVCWAIYRWVPDSQTLGGSPPFTNHRWPSGNAIYGWTVPVQPVKEWTATDSDDVDISVNYHLVSSSSTEFYTLNTLILGEGIAATPTEFSITVGYKALKELPPALADVILRMTAWLYENREISAMAGVDTPPYFNTLLAGYWKPRC